MSNPCLRFTLCLFLSILPLISDGSCLDSFKPLNKSSLTIRPLDNVTAEGLYIGVLHENRQTGERSLLLGPYFETHHRDIAKLLQKRGFDQFKWAGELRVENGQSKDAQVSAANEVAGMVKQRGWEDLNQIENLENYLYEHGLISAGYLGFTYSENPRHLAETLNTSPTKKEGPSEVANSTLRALLEIRSQKKRARQMEAEPNNLRHDFNNQATVIASNLSFYIISGEISPQLDLSAFKSMIENAWSYFKMIEDLASISEQREMDPVAKKLKKDLELLWNEVNNSLAEKRAIDLDKIQHNQFSAVEMRDRLIEFSKAEKSKDLATPSTPDRSEIDFNPSRSKAPE